MNLQNKLARNPMHPIITLANSITGMRLLSAFGLLFLTPFSLWFFLLYLLGAISDVLDGVVARHLKTESKLGARLDTLADTVFVVVVLIKIVSVVTIPVWLSTWTLSIGFIKCMNIICGFIRYQRFVPEHTVLNKVTGVFLFFLPLTLGCFPNCVLHVQVILTCVLATIAAIQEGHYIGIGREVV